LNQVRVSESSAMVARTIKEMQLRKEVGVIVMGHPENLRALETLLAEPTL
jgi:hypothetical protein